VKHKIVVISEETRRRAIEIIKALPLDPKHEVSIREKVKDRSADQNALYWKWLTVIGNELGESKEDVHERYKGRYLANIYERDNPDYAALIQTIREVWRHGMKTEALNLNREIIRLTSTTTATVKQMTEYLQSIEHDAASLAIKLPFFEQ
jgi:hypothetical protein